MFKGLCCLCKKDLELDDYPEDSDILSQAVVTNNLFSYSIAGIFKITDPEIDIVSGVICNRCLIDLRYEPYNNTVCSVCRTPYQNNLSMTASDQAHNCASMICEKSIDSYYGSVYDTCGSSWEEIQYNGDKPDFLKIGENICDFCIKDLLERGLLKEPKRSNTGDVVAITYRGPP